MDEERQTREEWLKFGGVSAAMFAVVLVVWLARPLVFDRVVPAFLGHYLWAEAPLPPAPAPMPLPPPPGSPADGVVPTDAVVPAEAPVDAMEGSNDDDSAEPAPPSTEPGPSLPAADPRLTDPGAAPSGPGSAAPAEAPAPSPATDAVAPVPPAPASPATANPATLGGGETLVHVVQPGETLTQIARNYGVTVEAIQSLNGLPNPHRIIAGEALRIPRR